MSRFVRPAGAALLVGAIHLALASRMTAPIIMADEWGYLGAARRLAGDGAETHVPYHAGAGLLYLPATLIADSPIDAYHGALATNAVLAGLLTLAAWWVAGLAEPLRPGAVRFAAACAVGLYTSFVGYSSLAAPEVAFAALELALVGVFVRALRERRAAWWALAGIGCGAAWLLHPRGAGVIAAGVLVAVLALRPAARHLPQLAAFLAPVLVGIVVTAVLDDWVNGTVLDPKQYDSGALFDGVLTAQGLRTLVITAAGQVFYLSAATIGVATLGALELVRRLRSVDRDRLEALFPLAALAFVYAISVATNARATRIDHLLYGRYNEGAIAPLLLVGFAVIAGSSAAVLGRRYVAAAGGITLATAVVFYGLAGTGRLHGDGLYYLVTVLGIDPVRRRIGWPDPLLIAAATFVAIYLVAAARRLGRVVPIAVVGLVFLVFAVKNTRDYFQPESRARSQEHVLADAIVRIDAVDRVGCVAYDRTTSSFFHQATYEFFAPVRFAVFVPGQEPPCGDLVISGGPLATTYPGARQVATETRARQALWVLPGATQDRLVAQGLLPPG
ncbi:MAG: hypothetical protein QOE98_2491 [Gaiellaceae bacterium]|nr:hypothetical protein [Gaiellaceae bacterium]